MEFEATQVYDDELSSCPTTSNIVEEKPVQVGTLSIDSKEYEIKTGITKIGRLSSWDICINDLTVSKTHAIIFAEIEAKNQQTKIQICDLNSCNKTKLDNEQLLPTRFYDLKDGSIIQFGKVHATYRAYCSMIIPETPAPSRDKVTVTIIPSTPDSSLNTSSCDDSIIFGTQRDEQPSVFRQPKAVVPQQRQSTNIDKKNTSNASLSESDDLQTASVLHTSNVNISESRKEVSSSIYDIETQKFEGQETTASNNIYDAETQLPTDKSTHHIQANTETDEQPQSNVQDEVATSALNIYDMETQLYENYISELESRKSKDNPQNVTAKTSTTDIHNVETQNYINDTNKNNSNTEKLETDKSKTGLDQIECNTNDLETQRVNDKDITEDISNIETQYEINDTVTNATRKTFDLELIDLENQLETDDIVNDINNDRTCTDEKITVETSTNKINDDNEKDKDNDKDEDNNKTNGDNEKDNEKDNDKDEDNNKINGDNETDKENMAETMKINYDIIAQSPYSVCSSPGSLNLSSPGVDEDCCSPLQHSDHLLESSDLLEYFGEGIDKPEEIRASNASTPKRSYMKMSPERDDNAGNVSSEDEDNIFDALTQRIQQPDGVNEKDVTHELPKEKCGPTKNIDDDPEMDMEEQPEKLVEKQCKSSEISDKSCNDSIDNRNDPGTSVESEDLYNALTQPSPVVKDISNLSVDPSKTNEPEDMAPTQINNEEDTRDQSIPANKPSTDINDDINAIGDGQQENGRKTTGENSAIDSVEEKLNEMFENVNTSIDEPLHITTTQALEDILESSGDNELSVNKCNVNKNSLITDSVLPTQLKQKSSTPCDQFTRNPSDTEAANNVNEVEADSQNSDIYFSTITTRRKRNILKETQELVKPTLQSDIEMNILDTEEIDSQNSDTYFSTITTRRKRNILKETQEVEPTPSVSSRQDSNISRISMANNEKTDDNNTATKINKRKRKISSKSESDTTTGTTNDDNITETISNENSRRSLRLSTKRKYEAAPKTSKRILRSRDSSKVEIDDSEKDLENESNVCAPCLSRDVGRAQTSDLLCESDDDILARLPAVRISGTLSNPPSPSASSTSTVLSTISNSKKNIVKKGKTKKIARNKKSLRKQDAENSEKDESPNRINDEPSVSLPENVSSFDTSKIEEAARDLGDTSEDSDIEMDYKRFKQMADRIFNNELDYLNQQDKKDVKNISNEKTNTHILSKDPKQDINDKMKDSAQISLRIKRHSNKQNKESSVVMHKEVRVELESCDKSINKSSKPETKSIVTRSTTSTIGKDEGEQTMNLRKRKAQDVEEHPILTRSRKITVKTIGRQSPNILDYFTTKSRESSPVIGNTKISRDSKIPKATISVTTTLKENQNLKEDENVNPEKSNIKQTRRRINADQAMDVDDVSASKSSVNNKQVQEKQTGKDQLENKVLKVVLSPIKTPIEVESQEVEMFMRKSPSNVQDKNLSIRKTNTAKIFQKNSRLGDKKQLNKDTESDSALTDCGSSSSSITIDDSDAHSDDSIGHIEIRKRLIKEAQTQAVEKKETFKKPARAIQISASTASDSSMENTNSENSHENDSPSSSRSSRSKTAGARKEKVEVTQRRTRSTLVKECTTLKISPNKETLSPSPTLSTKMRRNASVLSNSTSSITRHKVLFTGLKNDYSTIVKTLGGTQVEDPAKCSILVTDQVRRTYKFLCALARGIPIVMLNWLEDSKSAERFLDWEDYILKDPAAEAKFGFRLRKSLDKAKETKLLKNYTVLFTPNVAPPPIEILRDMVISCGGKVIMRPPYRWPKNTVIVSREEDLVIAKKFLRKAPEHVTVQSTEFILTGILRQETDFDKYKII